MELQTKTIFVLRFSFFRGFKAESFLLQRAIIFRLDKILSYETLNKMIIRWLKVSTNQLKQLKVHIDEPLVSFLSFSSFKLKKSTQTIKTNKSIYYLAYHRKTLLQ